MTPLASLWLPIVLTTVFIFIASSLIHTVLPWHKSDFAGLPDEAGFRRAVAPMGIPAGDYVVPHCTDMKEMSTPEHKAKLQEGPILVMTVRQNGEVSMAPMFIGWTVAILALTIVVAFAAGAALSPGASTMAVWHLTGLVALAGYGFGGWPESIWFGRKWSSAVKGTVDAVIYAVITAATFGWLWPAM